MAVIPLRVFISSPGDVGQERMIAARVLERLQGEFAAYVSLTPVLWEHEPLRATSHFQQQITAPSETDIVVCVLWSRLGTRLPGEFHRADGSTYASGTEWEFEDAYASFLKTGKPDLMVYRKTTPPVIDLHNDAAAQDKLAQKRALDEFIDRWFGTPSEGFKAAFHNFANADEFESTLDAHMRSLVRERIPERVADDAGASIPIQWFAGSPYRGLEAFDFEHSAVYFGRTQAIGEIKDALTRQAAAGRAFVLVLGMSGGGKSSLIRAGVLPTITHPGVVEGVGLWRRASFRPNGTAGDPFDNLAEALTGSTALPEADGGDALPSLLRSDPEAAAAWVSAALRAAAESDAKESKLTRPPVARLAVYVDQMEEVFTREGFGDDARCRFIACLDALARSGDVWVVATMRSDFYPRCAEIPLLVAMKEGAGQYDLLLPAFAEIGQMIRYPTRAAGLRFEKDPATGESLDDILHAAAANDPEALPLLEFTLDELFNRRSSDGILTLAAYRELGGLEGALARRAEEVFAALEPDQQEQFDGVIQALVTSGAGDAVASRPAAMDEIATSPERKVLIDSFIHARLLVTDRGGDGGAVVRVAHEALLRRWPRVRDWVSEHQEYLRIRDRVGAAALRWQQEDRRADLLLPQGRLLREAESLLEKRAESPGFVVDYITLSQRAVTEAQRKRTQIVRTVVGTFFAVVSGFGIFSFVQWQRSDFNEKHAMKLLYRITYDIPTRLSDVPAARPVLRLIFQENAAQLDEIAAFDTDAGAQRQREINLRYMGDMWRFTGDFDKAGSYYSRSLAIARTIAARSHGTEAEDDVAVALTELADIRKQSDPAQALSLDTQSRDILVPLLQRVQPADLQRKLQHDLSGAWERIGDVDLTLNRPADAATAYGQDLQIAKELLATAGSHADSVRSGIDMAISLGEVGDVDKVLGKVSDALDVYRQSRAILLPLRADTQEQLNALPTYNDQVSSLNIDLGDIERELLSDDVRIGDVLAETNAADALPEYESALAIALLHADDRMNTPAQHDLVTVYSKIGNARIMTGDMVGAESAFRSALPIVQRLALDPSDTAAAASLQDTRQMILELQSSRTNVK
ncbi:MAG: hypothetical protein ACLQVD_09290 [Capsulimonadaceae bacterium]